MDELLQHLDQGLVTHYPHLSLAQRQTALAQFSAKANESGLNVLVEKAKSGATPIDWGNLIATLLPILLQILSGLFPAPKPAPTPTPAT